MKEAKEVDSRVKVFPDQFAFDHA